MKKIILDLSKVESFNFDKCAIIVSKKLRRAGLFRENFLYSVFDADRLDIFLRYGTYRPGCNSIFAFNTDQFAYEGQNRSLIEFLDMYDNPGIGIYNGRELEEVIRPMYKFKNPKKKLNALVGVVERIIWPER